MKFNSSAGSGTLQPGMPDRTSERLNFFQLRQNLHGTARRQQPGMCGPFPRPESSKHALSPPPQSHHPCMKAPASRQSPTLSHLSTHSFENAKLRDSCQNRNFESETKIHLRRGDCGCVWLSVLASALLTLSSEMASAVEKEYLERTPRKLD